MADTPRLDDIGPPPPGSKELREIAPLLTPERLRRRWPWWLRIGLIGIASGAVVLVFGLWLVRREAQSILAAERAGGAAAGVVRAGFEARALGPTDAPIAVLLVHGFRSSPADFDDLPEQLAARGVYVVAPLLPGHGTCSEELAGATADDWIAAVQREYAELIAHHAEVRVAGFSMGAAIALVALADEPPARLALIAPYFQVAPRWFTRPSVESWARLAARLVDYLDTGPEIRGIADRERAADVPFYRVVPTAAVLQTFTIAERARSNDVLSRHVEALLVIISTNDSVADPRAARDVCARLGSQRIELQLVEESDHVLLWDHDAERVAAALVPFLTEP